MKNLKILSVGFISTITLASCGHQKENPVTNVPNGTNGTNGTNGIVPTTFINISGGAATCSGKAITISVQNNDSSTIACVAGGYDATSDFGGGNAATATIAAGDAVDVTVNNVCLNYSDIIIEDIICWNENGMNRIVSECECA